METVILSQLNDEKSNLKRLKKIVQEMKSNPELRIQIFGEGLPIINESKLK